MKSSGLSRQYIATKVTCNDKSIGEFALEAGNTANFDPLNISPFTRANIYQTSQPVGFEGDEVVLVAGR